MIVSKLKKDLNPTTVRVDEFFARKKSKTNQKEYENIMRFAPELTPHINEGELWTKTVKGVNGFDCLPQQEKLIVKWLFDLHCKGVAQGDFSPKDSFVDNNRRVWVVDWVQADNGLQFIDVLHYIAIKHWNKWNAKKLKTCLTKDSFFCAYLDLCLKELGKRGIERLKFDYSQRQPEQDYFKELMI